MSSGRESISAHSILLFAHIISWRTHLVVQKEKELKTLPVLRKGIQIVSPSLRSSLSCTFGWETARLCSYLRFPEKGVETPQKILKGSKILVWLLDGSTLLSVSRNWKHTHGAACKNHYRFLRVIFIWLFLWSLHICCAVFLFYHYFYYFCKYSLFIVKNSN